MSPLQGSETQECHPFGVGLPYLIIEVAKPQRGEIIRLVKRPVIQQPCFKGKIDYTNLKKHTDRQTDVIGVQRNVVIGSGIEKSIAVRKPSK